MNFKDTLSHLLNEQAAPMMSRRSMARPSMRGGRQIPGAGYGAPSGIQQGTFAMRPQQSMFGGPQTMPQMPQQQAMPQRRPVPYADPQQQAMPQMPQQPEMNPVSRIGRTPMAVPTNPQQMPQEQPMEFGGQPSMPQMPQTPEVQMQPPQAERMFSQMPTSTQMMGGPSSQPVSTPDMLAAIEPSMFANFMTNKMKSPAPTQTPQPQPQPQPQAQTQGSGTGMGMGTGIGMGMRMPRMNAPLQSPSMPTPEISQGQLMQPEYVPSELRVGDSGEFGYDVPSQYAISQNRYMSPEERMRRRKLYFRESIQLSLKKKNIIEQNAPPNIDDVIRAIEKREKSKLPDFAKSPEILLRKEQEFKVEDPSKYAKTSFKSAHEYGERMREAGRKFRANQFFLVPPEIATDFPNVTKGRFPYRSDR